MAKCLKLKAISPTSNYWINDKIKSEKFDYDRLKAVHLSEYQYLTRIIKDTIING